MLAAPQPARGRDPRGRARRWPPRRRTCWPRRRRPRPSARRAAARAGRSGRPRRRGPGRGAARAARSRRCTSAARAALGGEALVERRVVEALLALVARRDDAGRVEPRARPRGGPRRRRPACSGAAAGRTSARRRASTARRWRPRRRGRGRRRLRPPLPRPAAATARRSSVDLRGPSSASPAPPRRVTLRHPRRGERFAPLGPRRARPPWRAFWPPPRVPAATARPRPRARRRRRRRLGRLRRAGGAWRGRVAQAFRVRREYVAVRCSSSRRTRERPHRRGARRPRGAGRQGRRARRPDLPRLRGQGDPPRRRPQGRRVLHGRPRAAHRRAGGPRLHGRVELRLVHRLVRRGAHPQGPRPRDRRSPRAHRRGHHRLRPHAQLPAQEPAQPPAGLARDVRAAHQAVAAAHRDPLPLRGLRDRGQVRRRLRPRPRRPLPHARLHRRPRPPRRPPTIVDHEGSLL